MHKERHALLAVNLTSVCRAILAATIALWSFSNNQPANAGGDDISAEDAIPSRTLPASVAEHRMAGEPSETANSGSQAEPLPKVIGGETARPFQFPWQVALLRSAAAPDQPYQGFFCGGTRIRSNWVLTAAHCTYAESELPNGPPVELLPQDIDIYAGSVNFQGGNGSRFAASFATATTSSTTTTTSRCWSWSLLETRRRRSLRWRIQRAQRRMSSAGGRRRKAWWR